MAAEEVTLKLVNEVSGPADAATGSLGRLEAQIAREQAALGRLEGSLSRAKAELSGMASGEKVVDIGAYRRQQSAVQKLTDSIASKQDKISGLAEKLKGAGAAAREGEPPFRAIGKSMRMLGGTSGEVESKLTEMIHLFRKLGPEIAVVVAGVLVLGGAVGLAVGTFVKAIESANELRERLQKLSIAGVTMWNGQRASIASAEKLNESIEKVASTSAVAEDKIVGYATQLRNARFTGKQLEGALETMALAGAAGGDELANKFLEMAKNARYFDGNLEMVEKRFKDKFGAVASKALLNPSVQLAKLGENIRYIFSGADIEPLLKAMSSLLSIFDRNTGGAKTLRAMVTSFTEKAIGGILKLTIVLLKAYIWLRTHEKWWNLIKLAVRGVTIAFIAIAGVAAAMFAVIAAGSAIGAALVGALAAGLAKVYDTIVDVYNYFSSHSLAEIGTAMIDGLVAGIKAAGGKVLEALKSVVMGAVHGVEKVLGIGSPSRYMHDKVGYQMGAGTAGGMEESAPDVAGSAVKMVKAGSDAAQMTAGSAPKAASTGGGRTIQFNNCTFGEGTSEGLIRKWVHAALDEDIMTAEVA